MTLPYAIPPTAVPGQTLTAANWNTKVRDSLEALARKARCRVHRAAALNINTITTTPILWDAEQYDTDDFHSLAASTDRLTVPRAGVYFVRASIYYVASAAGLLRTAQIAKGGVAEYTVTNRNGTQVCVEVSGEVECVAGDYIQINAYQDSGAALALTTGKGNTDAYIRWVSL